MNETIVVDLNKEVVEWLKDHPLVSRRGICKSISVDPGNFHRWITGGTIPSSVLERLVPVLRLYGYGQQNGIQLDYVEVRNVTVENGEPVIPPEKKKRGKKALKKEAPKTEEKAVVEQSEFMGVKIPEGLTGIKLAVWKNEIKIKAKKK